jgi:two-component system KDP operon response regulator KdpE
MANSRILVVEDEPKVMHLVREILSASGYDVIAACNGKNAIEQAAMEQPDLVLLDLLLPGDLDGYEVARRLRDFSDIPIIMLTGKARDGDMLRGFEIGADDYITKPFNSKELLARIKAVLRRFQQGAGSRQDSEEITCGDVHIDLLRHRVSVRGREIHLTATEYNLLHELAIHLDQVLLHEQLLTAVWGCEYRDDVDYLRAYIHSLRQKIERDPSDPKLIVRCPGVGYSLVNPDGL